MKTNGYRIDKDARFPHPDLTPEEVIRIVMDALQHNDTPYQDAGIERAINFASTEFRPFPGPSEAFFEMVKHSAYSPLINCQSVEFDALRIAGNQAEQRITVTAGDGEEVMFVWILQKQTAPPHAGCWLTAGVARLSEE